MAQRQIGLIRPQGGKGLAVVSQSCSIPELKEPYDVLFRISAVALNPTNYKTLKYHAIPSTIMGRDFMGKVI